jgi:malate dehydrogenase (oxaloacetate-decarboxylating)(NADP+)
VQCCFNDDIQGTAAVTLAGLLSALRAAGVSPPSARILFHGAGEAGTGIGALWARYLTSRHNVPIADALRSCFFLDSKGLLCASRPDAASLPHHKRPFAHAGVAHVSDLASAVRALRPTALVGVSAQAGAFTSEVLSAHAANNPRPIVFALSNPTACAECTAAQAVASGAPGGRVLFASGSPFGDVAGGAPGGGAALHPSQANNAYIFPALGFGAALSRATSLPDDTFILAAEVLASMVGEKELSQGQLFPPLERIRHVSERIAAAVAAHAVADGRGVAPPGVAAAGGWEPYVRAQMWRPPPALESKL